MRSGTLIPHGTTQQIPLDFAPAAVLFWWALRDPAGTAPHNAGGLGFAARGSAGASVGWTSRGGVERSASWSWHDDAASVLHLDGDGTPEVQGSLSLDAAGFTIEWKHAPAGWSVQFLAFEAFDATSGYAQAPREPGDQHCEGVGFRPDLVLLAPALPAPPRSPAPGLLMGLGALTATGQASAGVASPTGMPPGRVMAAQRTGATLAVPASGLGPAAVAVGTGLTADGFGLRWLSVPASGIGFTYLALRGVRATVGATTSPRRPGHRRTGHVGFRPAALLCSSWGLPPSLDDKTIGRFSLGANAGGGSACASWDERKGILKTTGAHSRTSDRHVVLMPNTRGGNGLHGSAALRSVDVDGFTLHWDHSDWPRQLWFVALAQPGEDTLATRLIRLGRRIMQLPHSLGRRDGAILPRLRRHLAERRNGLDD